MSLDTLFPLTLSNSSLASFISCELKGFRAHIQHLKSPVSSPDLLAGGSFAKACELARKAFYNEGKTQEEAIQLGEEYILNSESVEHPIKTNERIATVFRKYIEDFPFTGGFKPCTLPDGSHAIEFRFEVDTGIPHPDLPDRNIMFTGLLDGLYERIVDGKVVDRYVLDEKTTSRISRIPGTKVVDLEKEADNFRASGQLIGYAFAAENLGIDITSALIRRVPILKNHEPAYELEIPITTFMKEQWAVATFTRIQELVDKYKAFKESGEIYPHSKFLPTYSGSCNSYNRVCNFMAGCLYKEGEDLLRVTTTQKVSVIGEDGERTEISLEDFKKQLGVSK